MEIYLIRHTTPSIDSGLIYGRKEVPLAESFETEAAFILSQIPPEFDIVYSSPSQRCSLLAGKIASEFVLDERLYEYNFGGWEGLNWNSINQEEAEEWMGDFVNIHPPGGENLLEMEERVLSFWNTVTDQSDKKVAIVTHGGVIRILVGMLSKILLKEIFSIRVGYGEIFYIKDNSYERIIN